ncbi:DUF427 domain-containing protein [Echinicola soli]|uniref:DUF427 domain-containing protein n=1 Tax=Echinicola soli TaxID=2591634 RepID=A0A514CE51_9BACT|nr:DUF427 domain-containing protein [Echinicola soli]QDH78102.1 DUF427 domain-containing protein [Echinicola soli]
MRAIWNDQVIADSDTTIMIENNHYFPPASIKKPFFTPSETTSSCPWKGEASYFDICVNGETNKDAAWHYYQPKEAAIQIKGYVAFWKGVKITR